MKKLSIVLLVTGLLALVAGCGDDDGGKTTAATADSAAEEEAAMKKKEAAAMKKKEAAAMKKEEAAASAGGTEIVASESDFGEMLFDSKKQAIYIFENDNGGKSTCYDDCAAAWPPVYTSGEPKAGKGVDASLLGTVKRRDGKLQVTYNDHPLYYYANEAPGEVRCHNVDLNGGFWWVIGPDGERRP